MLRIYYGLVGEKKLDRMNYATFVFSHIVLTRFQSISYVTLGLIYYYYYYYYFYGPFDSIDFFFSLLNYDQQKF